MTFYRISADDVHHRKKIGSNPIDKLTFYHSFGHTEDYILFPAMPMSIDTSALKNA